ncbi:MAG: type IV pilus secretin PilQ [Proteobacteria bacterium]|nr:type IV pilus secretin PilQ [Pseudomonadota bacterium]
MGVLSKALQLASLSVLPIIIGCATTNNSQVDTQLESAKKVDLINANLAKSNSLEVAATDKAATISKVEEIKTVTIDNQSGIKAERSNGLNQYTIALDSNNPMFKLQKLNNPLRLVLDLNGKKIAKNKLINVTDDNLVKAIRLSPSAKNKSRIVFDLASNLDSNSLDGNVALEGKNLVLTVKDLSNKTAAVAVAPKAEIAAVDTTKVERPVLDSKTVSSVEITDIQFVKSANDSGTISLETNNNSNGIEYKISKTSPSEYVLDLNNASLSENVPLPQLAPKGFPGIRVVRATKKGENLLVRLFIDQGIELNAKQVGSKLMVKADKANQAVNAADARAQLEYADDAKKPAAKDAKVETALSQDEVAKNNITNSIKSADGSKSYAGRLISLDLQDTDIDNALRIIAEVSNLNIIASDEVTGKVTLRLIDVPWDQALDVILKTNGLDMVAEGNVIRIAPIEKLRQEREALREAQKAAELLERLSVEYIRVNYARANDLKEQVESVLTERGTVSVDERTNQLIIKDTKSGHDQSRELLKKLDLRTPQVLLETQIVESSRGILRDLGFEMGFANRQSPQTGNATGFNFPNTVIVKGSNGANGTNLSSFPAAISDTAGTAVTALLESADGSRSLSARLSALEVEKKVRVISRPQVSTINNKQAEISSSETVRIKTPNAGTAISTGSGASAVGSANSAFEEFKVGIVLTVTPQASPDYYVLMDVEAKSSTFGSHTVDGIPSTLDREATSTILVKSGQTFALGGIYRLTDTDEVDGVPFLKDIPVIGAAFRRTLVDKGDEELIFFITPHIVEGSFDLGAM